MLLVIEIFEKKNAGQGTADETGLYTQLCSDARVFQHKHSEQRISLGGVPCKVKTGSLLGSLDIMEQNQRKSTSRKQKVKQIQMPASLCCNED